MLRWFAHGEPDAEQILSALDAGIVPKDGWEPVLRELLHAYCRLAKRHLHLTERLAAETDRHFGAATGETPPAVGDTG